MAENAIYALRGTALIEGQQDDGTLNKTLLDFITTQIRISIRVEQTRFGREQRAGAVHFNCAAF